MTMVIDHGHFCPYLAAERKEAAVAAHVSKSNFKAKALEYFRQIEATGEPIVITERGRPKLEIRPVGSARHDPRETLRGALLKYDDPFEPVGVDDWEALK